MNVIMILCDDLGWADVSLHGRSDFFETPHLDRLARQGVSFERAYAASPLCAPTRASIISGQNPARLGLTQARTHLAAANAELRAYPINRDRPGDKSLFVQSAGALDSNMPSLPRLIRDAGYATGHFGKWHLGFTPFSPTDHGFDVEVPEGWNGPAPAGNFVAPWRFPNFHPNSPDEHIEDRMAEEAVAWMEQQVAAGKPFYMHYWQFSVHSPFDAKEELIQKYREKLGAGNHHLSPTYAAMVESMDDSIGTLMDAVERLGIADRTAIIFFSDNGGDMLSGIREVDAAGTPFLVAPSQNAPLRAGKATMWEGGVRVPAVIYWPGVTPENVRSNALIQTTDLYPTILSLLQIPLSADHPIDGLDITPALQGEDWQRPEGMITYFPHDFPVPDWLPPSISVHFDDWKLIRVFHYGERPGEHQYFLYNLADDIGEQNNLADRYPERVQQLDRMIEDYIVGAAVVTPPPNPDFDPAHFRPELIGQVPAGPRIENGLRVADTREERLARFAREDAARAAATRTLDRPPHGESELGDWRSGRPTVGMRLKEGVLWVDSTGPDGWIELDLKQPLREGAPFALKLEVYAPNNQAMRLYGRHFDGRGFRAQDVVNVAIPAANRWLEVSGTLIGGDELRAIRINMPGNIGETRLRNIRLLNASGEVLQQWF